MNESIIRDDIVHGIHLRFEDLKELNFKAIGIQE